MKFEYEWPFIENLIMHNSFCHLDSRGHMIHKCQKKTVQVSPVMTRRNHSTAAQRARAKN